MYESTELFSEYLYKIDLFIINVTYLEISYQQWIMSIQNYGSMKLSHGK